MAHEGVRAAKAVHEAELLDRANVVGVAVGHKVVRGRETDETCIVVYVDHKEEESRLSRWDRVPKSLDGVRTDVVETGRFRALELLESVAVDHMRRMRPAPGGVSIAHPKVTAGTLGILAHRTSGEAVILSNNHVLANSNDASPGDPILQPGPYDGGGPQDAIGSLADFVPIQFKERNLGTLGRFFERALAPVLAPLGLGLQRLPSGKTNLVDAAIAAPGSPGLVAPDILEIGRVEGTADPALGMRIRKSGRTTGLTQGRITGLDAVVEVDYGGKSAVFRAQIVSDILSRGGDSGSLIVDEAGRAVGLLFAGGQTTTILNPIDAVLGALGLRL
jgi:hypothetical protein